MSGHNKWSKVKHKKAITDAKKSKVFSKHAAIIAAESKKAKGNRDSQGLKTAIARAKAENMPSDNIERAIQKGVRLENKGEETIYEAYAPGGVAIIITTVTDNKNRTTAEIKHIIAKNNGSFSEPGAVMWAFKLVHGVWEPTSTIPVTGKEREGVNTLVEQLENHDDVQNVFSNAKI